jgi:hypothetical protein
MENAAIDGAFGSDLVIVKANVFAVRQNRAAKNASAKLQSSLESDAS